MIQTPQPLTNNFVVGSVDFTVLAKIINPNDFLFGSIYVGLDQVFADEARKSLPRLIIHKH
jgi:hypothetical protein